MLYLRNARSRRRRRYGNSLFRKPETLYGSQAPSLIFFHLHQALQVLDNWQLKWRNKIEDCGIENRIDTLMPRLSPEWQALAQQLLGRWRELPLDYEIPRIDPVSRYRG